MGQSFHRLIIRPYDIALVMGLSLRQSYRHYHIVRDANKKSHHHALTIAEFAAYYDIPIEDIWKILRR